MTPLPPLSFAQDSVKFVFRGGEWAFPPPKDMFQRISSKSLMSLVLLMWVQITRSHI